MEPALDTPCFWSSCIFDRFPRARAAVLFGNSACPAEFERVFKVDYFGPVLFFWFVGYFSGFVVSAWLLWFFSSLAPGPPYGVPPSVIFLMYRGPALFFKPPLSTITDLRWPPLLFLSEECRPSPLVYDYQKCTCCSSCAYCGDPCGLSPLLCCPWFPSEFIRLFMYIVANVY